LRRQTSASWAWVRYGERRASLTARVMGMIGAQSSKVRAGLVTRMPRCVRTSDRASFVVRWTISPDGRRSVWVMTWTGLGQRLAQPHRARADVSPRFAAWPQARTAAAACSIGVVAGVPTE
jgi:hypothetical protein